MRPRGYRPQPGAGAWQPYPPTPPRGPGAASTSPSTRRVVQEVFADETVYEHGADAEIEVQGDVYGTVLAQGAGARVIVYGDVHKGARVGAKGANAVVEVRGRVL